MREQVHGPARRLWQLVKHLPQESATWRGDGWSQQEELLATLIEVTDGGLVSLAQLQVGKRVSIPKHGMRVLRPGEEAKEPPNVVSIEQFQQMTGGGEN